MPYQIGANVAALNVYNNLGVHQAKSAASLARISSGLKSAGGGDVASAGTGATINKNMQATQSYISQVQFALSQLQAADTAFGELIALGQKGLEIASRATDAGADVSALAEQSDQITAGITSIQTATQFNGAGITASATANPDVGSDNFDASFAFATAPSASSTAAYSDYVDDTVDARAANAGNIASLQNTLQVLNSVAANELQAMSQVQDTDIAKEMMNLTSANILSEAATAMLAQAMQLPNNVLRLLQ